MRYVKIILGNLLITSAYAFLTVPNEIVNGGVTSFSMILSPFLHIDISAIADMLTILLLILCYLFLGKDYFRGTIVGGICYILFFTFFHSIDVTLFSFRPLAAFLAALMVGTGYFLSISQKATAISFDTVALILHKKHPRLNVPSTIFLINVCILVSGIFQYGLSSVLLGIFFSAVQSLTLNQLLKTTHTGG